MIAMQYSIPLPADYDMAIIDRRIADKGSFTDGFPGLLFKAYLSARNEGTMDECENLYAPFYLWRSSEGMNDFLCGPGFAGLTRSFGWPSVKTWSVWQAEISPEVARARFAIRESMPIAPFTHLDALRTAESERVKEAAAKPYSVAVLVGFDPACWNLVRFQLLTKRPPKTPLENGRIYTIGHVSTG